MKSAIEKTLFKSAETILSIKADGSVLADGFNPAVNALQGLAGKDACTAFTRENKRPFIPADAAAGTETIFIISKNGDVLQFGQNDNTSAYGVIRADGWTDITEIVADRHAVGLRKDGTVVASGYNEYGQCQVSGWSDIRHIACSLFVTAGIKNDGSVVVCGETSGWKGDIHSWKNIQSLYCSDDYLLGVDGDGNAYYYGEENDASTVIAGWKNVRKIIGSDSNIAALTADGTVLAVSYEELEADIKAWKNIEDIAFASYTLVGLDKGGKVFVAGNRTVNHFSEFENKVWNRWSDILKIVSFNSGFLGLTKDGNIRSCLPDTWDFGPEQLPKAKKWKCFSCYDTIDQDYEEGLAKLREKLSTVEKEAQNQSSKTTAAPKRKKLSPNATWLEKTIANADSDEEKLKAMDSVCRMAKKENLIFKVPSLVFQWLFLLNSFAAFWGIMMLLSDSSEKAIIDTFPSGAKSLLLIFEKGFLLWYNILIRLMSLFRLHLPESSLSLIAMVASGVLLVFVLPPLISRVVRKIIQKAKNAEPAERTLKWSDPKVAAKETFAVLSKLWKRKKSNYATRLPSLLLAAVVVFLTLYISSYPNVLNLVTAQGIITAVLSVAGAFLTFQLIGLIPKLIARAKRERFLTFRYSKDTETFENFWAEFDEEKKAELERRAREREARRRQEERERERRAAEASRRATITFDATGIHSANELTVYVDGNRECSFSGGRSRDITISPGRHRVQVRVYNDASESAYSMDPMEEYFEAGGHYTVDYS